MSNKQCKVMLLIVIIGLDNIKGCTGQYHIPTSQVRMIYVCLSVVCISCCAKECELYLKLYVQWGHTALWCASFWGHHGSVKMLIEAGADVDIPREVSVPRLRCTRISERQVITNLRTCCFLI